MPCYIFAVLSLTGQTCDEHLPRVRLNMDQNNKTPLKPQNHPRNQHFSTSVLYRTAQLTSWQRRGAKRKLFYFLNVRLRWFQSEEKLDFKGFNVVSFPPFTAHSELLNPKHVCVTTENPNYRLNGSWSHSEGF